MRGGRGRHVGRRASRASSSSSEGGLIGIVTDRDLRNRVLAVGLDRPPGRCGTVMTPDPCSPCAAEAAAFEALLEMVSRDIHHLPVVDEPARPVGTGDHHRPGPAGERQPGLPAATSEGRRPWPAWWRAGPGHPRRAGPARRAGRQRRGRHRSGGDRARRRRTTPRASRWSRRSWDRRRRRTVGRARLRRPRGGGLTGRPGPRDRAGAEPDQAATRGSPRLAHRVTAALVAVRLAALSGRRDGDQPPLAAHRRRSGVSASPLVARARPDSVLHTAIFHDMRHLSGDPSADRAGPPLAASTTSPRLLGHLAPRRSR